jgi:hypothetical protein
MGCEFSAPAHLPRHIDTSHLIDAGLAALVEHSELDDVKFTAQSLGLILQSTETDGVTTYQIEQAPPEILTSSFRYEVRSGLKRRTELKFLVKEKDYCITPDVLQEALGDLKTSPRTDENGKNIGVILEPSSYPIYRPGGLTMLLQVGTGCLDSVEIVQDEALAGPRRYVDGNKLHRRQKMSP